MPIALSAEDYIELLPARWQAVNVYGIKINHRVYDSEELNPFRRQPSGVTAKKDLWEVHHDPYDVSRVWVRNHRDGGWITATWKHLASVPAPFGELAWDHARQQLKDQGRQATEAEIAGAVAALLERASSGPAHDGGRAVKPSKRDQRVAARKRRAPPGPGLTRPARSNPNPIRTPRTTLPTPPSPRWCRCRCSMRARRPTGGGDRT